MASNKTTPNFAAIVQEISNIIQNDQDLESFDIIPIEEAGDTSPLKYEEHNIGLEFWCVKVLYPFVHQEILRKTLDTASQKAFLNTALLLNPSVKTFWNMKREFVSQKQLDIASELRFTDIVISFCPKSPDAFYYRRWLLKQILTEKPMAFVFNELVTIQEIAERHSSNNHLPWDHCAWLLDHCPFHEEFPTFIDSAYTLSGQYASVFTSDASHFSFRQRLIKQIINNRDKLTEKFLPLCKKTLKIEGFTNLDDDDSYLIGITVYELQLNGALIDFYANREGLWCYRRFVVYIWFKILPTMVSDRGKVQLRHLISDQEDCDVFKVHFSRLHESFIAKLKNNVAYVEKYKDWIKTYI